VNEELQERIDSAEIQIQSISSHFKTILNEKDLEISELKQTLSSTNTLSTPPLGMGDDILEFEDDPYMLKTQIQMLNQKNQDLSKELDEIKWKVAINQGEDSTELREAHQQEMASLMSTHNQRLAILKKKHKIEMKNLKQKLDALSNGEILPDSSISCPGKRSGEEIDESGNISPLERASSFCFKFFISILCFFLRIASR
jgi:DNA repair ATPase RecN